MEPDHSVRGKPVDCASYDEMLERIDMVPSRPTSCETSFLFIRSVYGQI